MRGHISLEQVAVTLPDFLQHSLLPHFGFILGSGREGVRRGATFCGMLGAEH